MSTRERRGGRHGGRRPAREEFADADSDLEQHVDDDLSDLEADDADGSGADVGDDQRAKASQNLPPTDRAPADASDRKADVAVGDEPHPTPANSGEEEDPYETTVHRRDPHLKRRFDEFAYARRLKPRSAVRTTVAVHA